MLKKYFLSNILIMLFLNGLVKPLWVFLIDRNVQLTVGHQEYGMYNALVSLTIIFNILLDVGITNMNNRELSADRSKISFSLPNMMIAKMLLGIVYFSAIFLLGLALDYSGRALYLLFLLGGVQLLNSFLQYLRSYVSAHHEFKTDSFLSVLDKLIMIFVCSILLFSTQFKDLFIIEWFIYTQLAAYGISIIIALFIVFKRYSRFKLEHISFAELKKTCVQSLPYAALILLMGIYMRSDSLMLERIEGAEQNSYYAATYRLLDIANMSGFLFAGILMPMFSRLLSKKLDVSEIIHTSSNILLSISMGVVAFGIMYSSSIMELLYPKDYTKLDSLFAITIASFPAFCIMYIFSSLLTANGNISLLVKIALLGSIMSVTLNFILIKMYKAEGAAIATNIVEWTLAILYIYFSQKKIKFHFNLRWILKFLILFACLLSINIGLRYYHISFYAAMLTTFFAFILLVFGLGIWDRNMAKDYIKQFISSK